MKMNEFLPLLTDLVFLKWEISYKIWKFTHNYFIYVKEQLQFTLILNQHFDNLDPCLLTEHSSDIFRYYYQEQGSTEVERG